MPDATALLVQLQLTHWSRLLAIQQFEGNASLGTWLYRIAHNASLERLRYKKRRGEITVAELGGDAAPGDIESIGIEDEPADLTALDELIENQEFRLYLDQAIAALPEKLRQVLVLRDLDGLSVPETSERLQISPSAVKVRLHRARAKLRETLKEYYAFLR